jgi:ABC-type transport system involved in Fe-S cluster assembly fused permease/ATPase subunit
MLAVLFLRSLNPTFCMTFFCMTAVYISILLVLCRACQAGRSELGMDGKEV